MGLGWHVALQQDVPGIDGLAVTSRALLFAQHDLDEIAGQLGLDPITTFVSPDPGKVADYLRQQGLNPEDFPIPEQDWFPAADGLRTVQGLLAFVRGSPGSVQDAGRVLLELQSMEKVLAAAERAQVDFHLTSDLPDADSLG